MENLNLRIATALNKMAKELIADYHYIYDPEHHKRPGGGYQKTEKGWQKGKDTDDDNSNQMSKEQAQLDRLVNNKYKKIRERIVNNWNAHPDTLDKLANDESTYIREKVAEHPNTKLETLIKLSNDKEMWVRYGVAKNRNTPAEVLDKLSQDKELDDGLYHIGPNRISEHPNTMAKTLDRLSNHRDRYIRYNVAMHPNTSIETLKKLANNDKSKSVKDMAQYKLKEKSFFDAGLDLSKLSPELREKVDKWDI